MVRRLGWLVAARGDGGSTPPLNHTLSPFSFSCFPFCHTCLLNAAPQQAPSRYDSSDGIDGVTMFGGKDKESKYLSVVNVCRAGKAGPLAY